MNTLSEKLSFFQQDLDNDPQVRSDTFSTRIRLLEDKVTKLQISEEAKLNVIIT